MLTLYCVGKEAPEIFPVCPDVDSSCVEYAFTVRYLLLQENLKDTFYSY
jgi:hypothetical protein